MLNYYLDIASANKATDLNNSNLKSPAISPNFSDISKFKQAFSSENGSDKVESIDKCASCSPTENELKGSQDSTLSGEAIQQLLMMIIELLEKLNKAISGNSFQEGEDSSNSSSLGQGENPAKIHNGNVTAVQGDAQGGNIPKPTQHLDSFNMGGKKISIGGDGTASAAEVQSTKETMIGLYQNSPSFRNMLDSSPNDSFEVSVGRRSDNTSWGNSDGRIFMNINNISPGTEDNFQALTAHEFAHAAVNQEHGAEMQNFEQRVAREA